MKKRKQKQLPNSGISDLHTEALGLLSKCR